MNTRKPILTSATQSMPLTFDHISATRLNISHGQWSVEWSLQTSMQYIGNTSCLKNCLNKVIELKKYIKLGIAAVLKSSVRQCRIQTSLGQGQNM